MRHAAKQDVFLRLKTNKKYIYCLNWSLLQWIDKIQAMAYISAKKKYLATLKDGLCSKFEAQDKAMI